MRCLIGDRRIKLKRILEKCGAKAWTGFKELRTGSSGGL
jgi:hypothetical protein